MDVRDVAALIEAVLQRGGQHRYIVPGHHVDGRELYAAAAEAAGRRLPHIVLPGPVIAPPVRLLEAAQRRFPQRWHYPADREGVEILRRDTRFDDSAARRELGIVPVPFRQTIMDTVRWLVESGRLPAPRAPRLKIEQGASRLSGRARSPSRAPLPDSPREREIVGRFVEAFEGGDNESRGRLARRRRLVDDAAVSVRIPGQERPSRYSSSIGGARATPGAESCRPAPTRLARLRLLSRCLRSP